MKNKLNNFQFSALQLLCETHAYHKKMLELMVQQECRDNQISDPKQMETVRKTMMEEVEENALLKLRKFQKLIEEEDNMADLATDKLFGKIY